MRTSFYFEGHQRLGDRIKLSRQFSVSPVIFSRILLTGQVPDKLPSSNARLHDKLHSDNPNIIKLIRVIGEQSLSVKEMMAAIELKHRENFLNLYLTPAINEGFVKMQYPNSPRHPRQKYLLTAKGVAVYQG